MNKKKILVVEDEMVIRSSLRRLLNRNGYDVSEADSVDNACEFDLSSFALVISDLRLPGAPGTEMIHKASKTPVLIMTSYASLRSAVDSMKQGAVDYIAKPFDHDELIRSVANIITHHKKTNLLEKKGEQTSKSPLKSADKDTGIIGESQIMKELYKRIEKVAPTNATVLIQGESGTGKELVARALHEQSPRKDHPMISVNCAAIPETLIESELFGHEKGAFTGAIAARNGLIEAADNGTLFLDEIGELPLEAQARLLRVLQENEIRRIGSVQSKKVNVRLLAATHRQLKKLASKGLFREDLYYRLNVVSLNIPPLYQRDDDVTLLAESLKNRICQRMRVEEKTFSTETMDLIKKYSWPGNVRELENAIERAIILCDESIIEPELLDIEIDDDSASSEQSNENILASGNLSLDEYFQHFIIEHQSSMTETDLARKLGVSRKSLWERRKKLGIPRKKASSSYSESTG